ncbi:MAG TPA: TorF family putative porin, partial [Hyphomicrobium sp.]
MTNIKSFLGAAGAAAIAALSMSTAARAADLGTSAAAPAVEERKFGYSVTISGTSDYIFRGISYTNSDPAFQPFIEFTYGTPNLTWYLDFWGSNIAEPFGPFEVDMYAGVRPVTGPVAWDLGILYYTYPENNINPGNPLSPGRN